jgi:hypothetical protein
MLRSVSEISLANAIEFAAICAATATARVACELVALSNSAVDDDDDEDDDNDDDDDDAEEDEDEDDDEDADEDADEEEAEAAAVVVSASCNTFFFRFTAPPVRHASTAAARERAIDSLPTAHIECR